VKGRRVLSSKEELGIRVWYIFLCDGVMIIRKGEKIKGKREKDLVSMIAAVYSFLHPWFLGFIKQSPPFIIFFCLGKIPLPAHTLYVVSIATQI
jgi:hypothetical protein